jgi:hypothetical protein
MRVALVVSLLVALGAIARADSAAVLDDRSVGVVVQGGGSLRLRVEEHIAQRLRREGYTANDEPLSRDALNTIANCFIIEDLACARGVFEARSRTPRLVFARIDDSTGAVTMDVSAKRACSECARTWQEHTDDLIGTLSAQARMPIVSEVEPDPEQPKRGSKLWPRLLVVAGAAAVVTGGVLLYYGLRDGAEHKYVYPQLTPVGITAIAVGGGAMIGGIITW